MTMMNTLQRWFSCTPSANTHYVTNCTYVCMSVHLHRSQNEEKELLLKARELTKVNELFCFVYILVYISNMKANKLLYIRMYCT